MGMGMEGNRGVMVENEGAMTGEAAATTMEEQLEMVAKAFVDHYYNTFDNGRALLGPLYAATSLLSFEGQMVKGVADIVQKLTQLPFDQCRHHISTIDSQPSGPAGGILVFVSGNLQLPGEEHHLRFSQVRLYVHVHVHIRMHVSLNSYPPRELLCAK
ncbi:hypothetical protein AMTRI_Chr02g259530 [Amborella trichopoda]